MLYVMYHQLKGSYAGHVLCKSTSAHEHISHRVQLREGKMLGKATRGRKRIQMLSDVTSKTYEDLKREAGTGVAEEIAINLP